MGTWSHDAFGNDTACDWAAELTESDDLSPVKTAIKAVVKNNDDYIDAQVGEEALVAIEVVARLRGNAGYHNTYTESVDDWVATVKIDPSLKLLQDAMTALDLIVSDRSELKELWSETNVTEWLDGVKDLRSRLMKPPKPIERPAAATTDKIEDLIQSLAKIQFQHVEVNDSSSTAVLYNAILASVALYDIERTRTLIAQMWNPIAQANNESILWDLAVREAQTWAIQGFAEAALSQLSVWRISPATQKPGLFEYRATSVCLSANDIDGARKLYYQAIDANPSDLARHFDLCLLEARKGDANTAKLLLQKISDKASTLPRMFVALLEGIIAVRLQQPNSLSTLTEASEALINMSSQSPAAWTVLSYCCGWLALALKQANKSEQAIALLKHVQPILCQPYNQELLNELKDGGLLDANISVPRLPLKTNDNSSIVSADVQTDHGSFRSLRVRGVNALKTVESLLQEFNQGSGKYPFLIGSEEELAQLLDMISPPQDGGSETLQLARNFNVEEWLKVNMPKATKAWPKQTVPPIQTPLIQFDVLTQRLKQDMVIGMIEVGHPSEVFAKFGYGDWNDCPAPHIHTALHDYWGRNYQSLPVVISQDTVECYVPQPTTEKQAAMQLSREHHAYCYDIVEQGVGTTAKLASSLLESKYWHFWWD